MMRPHCELPHACIAKGGSHCQHCNMRRQIRKLNADPEFKAANAERMRKLHADRNSSFLSGLDEFASALFLECRGEGFSMADALDIALDDMSQRERSDGRAGLAA